MEDPNLILTLKPTSKRAILAFGLAFNEKRYIPPPPDPPLPVSTSRETTPSTAQNDGTEYSDSQIRLTFDREPKDIEQGFVFGSDQAACDVLLGHSSQGISRQEFRITLDTHGRPILEAVSQSHSMTVSYDTQGKDQKRRLFKWILFQGHQIVIKISNLKLEIDVAEHNSCQEEYQQHVLSFLADSRPNATAPLERLGIDSLDSTAAPSRTLSPRQRPIYFKEKELGRGEFGRVYTAIDVSTGHVYASKQFDKGHWHDEVEAVKRASHEHIVPFIDFTDEIEPLLVMEYLPLGNLQEQHRVSPITIEETVTLLSQGLEALDYLNSIDLAHRDIKPANILVQSRQPFSIKLADFGLAKDISALLTRCGSYLYAAPEVFRGDPYTANVDVWSLGVVIFQYGYGLPRSESKFTTARWYAQLAREVEQLARAVEDGDSDNLIDFLSENMLKEDPEQRLSAGECLDRQNALLLSRGPLGTTRLSPDTEAEDPTLTEKVSTSELLNALRTRESLEAPEPEQALTQLWDPPHLHGTQAPAGDLHEPEQDELRGSNVGSSVRSSVEEGSRRQLKRPHDET